MNKPIKVPAIVNGSDGRSMPIIDLKDFPKTRPRWARWQAALNYQMTPKIAPINFAIPDEPYRQ